MYKSILSAMLGAKNLNGDGKKAGNGKNTYMNGDRYDGTWKNDVRDGYGTQYFASGDKYEGAWANDAMHGAGIYSYAAGDRVEGEWREGKPHGRLTFYPANSAFSGAAMFLHGRPWCFWCALNGIPVCGCCACCLFCCIQVQA